MIEALTVHEYLEAKDKEAGIYIDDTKIDDLSNLSEHIGRALIVCGVEEWLGLDNTRKWAVRFCTVVRGKNNV